MTRGAWINGRNADIGAIVEVAEGLAKELILSNKAVKFLEAQKVEEVEQQNKNTHKQRKK
jgi:hypothetical protein